MKKGWRIAGAVAGLLVAIAALALLRLYTEDYTSHFARQRGTFSYATVLPASSDSLTTKSWLTVTNSQGFSVECGMLTPRDSSRRYPAIVLLGGKTTGKNAVDYALGIADAVIIALDYPYEPQTQYTLMSFLADAPTIREALLNMVPSAMLVFDYLRSRRDVDTTKIVVLGYSFGAPFIPCIAANERRCAAAVMVYGAGELRTLIRHNVNRYEGKLMSEFVGTLGAMLLAPLEPLHTIERVAPIPLIMINGTNDEMIPRQNVEMLYAKGKEPKKLIWIESRHVNPRDTSLTATIVEKLRSELSALGVF